MPFVPDVPETISVPVLTDKVIDTYQIEEITIRLPPNDHALTSVSVRWSKGYMENGVYVVADTRVFTREGAPVLQVMMASVTAGASHYGDIKSAIWQFMFDEGEIPLGSVG
jgi:hypothetical protein